MAKKDNNALIKVRFSIGAKLIIIITFIVLFSLGSIIALASLLIRGDLRVLAEENNMEINRRTAMAAESHFENVYSNSVTLIRTITTAGTSAAQNNFVQDTIDYFFERNPNYASVFFSGSGQQEIFINNEFFGARILDPLGSVQLFRDGYISVLRRADAGETVFVNAAPFFGTPLLAMFFPWAGGGACVLFSTADLHNFFSKGVNQSYLINDNGDIMIHADIDMIQRIVNTADSSFVKYIRDRQEDESARLHTGEDGIRYFGAFTKLKTAGATVITNVEYDKVFENIDATTLRNIFLTITVLSISIILIWFFAKSISIPLKSLAIAAHDIESGIFEISLKPKTRDEIGVLTASFHRMCKALHIFGRFTNRDIAVRAMRGEIKPGGFPKKATIFFSDIREFTSISETFTNIFNNEASDKIVHWLNEYFTQMIECVEKTGGVVDKFIGDALMAHWGTAFTTGSTRKDAYNCVKAALYMRTALKRLNKGRTKENPENPRIKIGIGINTGTVTAGQLGSDRRMEYTAIGDPVNLASRVESLCKGFGTDILIAENTWKLVRRRFVTVEMPSVKVKGKSKPVRIFAVINFAKNPKGPKSITRLRRVLRVEEPSNLKLDTNSIEPKYIFTDKR
ncbi:MAG: HAMP domain-containing protein [Treponema sp.]|nr:HAMP domain-containing protein [Treponema sp.]